MRFPTPSKKEDKKKFIKNKQTIYELNKIISITGKPGLYELKTQTKNGFLPSR